MKTLNSKSLKQKKQFKPDSIFNTITIKERLYWINKYIIQYQGLEADKLINFWCDRITHLIKHHGPVQAIIRLKQIRLHVTRFLSGKPLLENQHNIKLNKSGLPSELGPLLGLVEDQQDPKSVRLLFTLLILSRSINIANTQPELSSIDKPFTGDEDVD